MDPTEDETPAGGAEGVTPEVNTPSLLDSINAALEPTLPKAEETNDEGTTDEDESELGEGEAGDEDEAGEGAAARNADGTFKSAADGKGKAGEGAGKTPAGDGKLGADGKPVPVLGLDGKPLAVKADPVNDPIPEDVKGRTRERMTSLIAAVKEKDEHIAVQNQLFDSIQSTGATPEEFGAMLGYMRWVHSDKPEDLKQARTLLLSELEGLSLKLGEAAPGVDFLSKYPDLQEKVNNGQITVDDANEMALHRQRTKVQTDQTTQQRTQQETAQAATTERNAAIKELNELGSALSGSDPDYARKHEMLKPMIDVLGTMPPKQWKTAFMNAYKALKLPAAGAGGAAPVAGGNKPPGNQPLRGNKVPSGSSARAPTSMLDAVSAAIDAAG
jgi:hypothetical protein